MTTSSKKTIVFDLGGVLIDWNPRYLFDQLFNHDADKVSYFLTHICTSAWNLEQDRGRPFKEAVEILSKQHPEFAEEISAYNTQWEQTIGGPINETVEILKQLRQAGYPVFALTNWSAEKFSITKPKFPFLNWFEGILVSGEVKLIKPDPAIYQLLFKTFNLDPKQCIFIDDSPVNIQASIAEGMPGIVFKTASQLKVALLDMHITF